MDNIEQLRKVATRAGKLLTSLSKVSASKKRNSSLPSSIRNTAKPLCISCDKLSKGSVEYAVAEMEAGGYIFKKKPSGNTMKYAMTIQNVIDLYNHRKVPNDTGIGFDKAFTIFVCNLKGGGSKTVSTASLSHAFRAHPQLLFEDLRILAIDFDPQASLTMF
ncbi:hypothetical protein [Pseudomonas aeruginosa]|uniref:hypothetical protein n=1 Tax=Pseudomonas aeruginosa TaxID=287 RepID=UPI00265A1D0A|nr:hypothetical protein [Pseudomonas aeruginosa]